MSGAGVLRRFGLVLLDVLYPRRCVLCASADDLHREWPLCVPCLSQEEIFEENERLCPRCAMPLERFYTQETRGGCRWCSSLRLAFDAAAAAGRYEDRLRELILLYKYQDRLQLREHLAQLAAAAGRTLQGRKADLVCPIPPAPSRLRRRGYDPILDLARRVSGLLLLPFDGGCLLRVKDTPPLAKLSRKQRAAELAGAFRAADPERVKDKSVIVVDDVLTTGATLSEAARALKAAGAKRVLALAVARTLDQPAY